MSDLLRLLRTLFLRMMNESDAPLGANTGDDTLSNFDGSSVSARN